MLILAPPMSEEGHSPDKTMFIIHIICILANKTKINLRLFSLGIIIPALRNRTEINSDGMVSADR
jgi:hypothetical protein